MLLPEKYNFSLNRNIAHFQFEGNNIKKVGTGQQKDGKEGGTKKKQLEKHLQLIGLIGNKSATWLGIEIAS